MEPSLHHGDRLIHLRVPLRPGDIAVARDPHDTDRWIVKRVASIDAGRIHLASDRAGHETLTVDRSSIVGRVVLRYRPVARFRLL